MADYANSARGRGIHVIIAGAGGAAHLPGMIAAHTTLPVLGVPVESKALQGMDSLLSIVQMPGGVPVGNWRLAKLARLMLAVWQLGFFRLMTKRSQNVLLLGVPPRQKAWLKPQRMMHNHGGQTQDASS